MGEHDPKIALVTEPLPVQVAEGEIVLLTQHDAASLTAAAAEETARRLTDAADQLKRGC